MRPKPLTRRNRKRELYLRLPEVEDQIAVALQLDVTDLLERASISGHKLKGFFQEECLVYMIRHYYLAENHKVVSKLFELLMSRCIGFAYERLVSLGEDKKDEAYREVIKHLVDNILEFETGKGDYFQVRFWVGLERLAISEFGRQLRIIKEDQDLVSLDNMCNEEDRGLLKDMPDTSLSQEELTLCKDAIGTLKDPQRTAFLLRYYHGWPIESKDANCESISSYYDVDPRTVRNWLSQAEKDLQKWGKGERQ